jgi:hypothetical protein
LAPSSLRNIEAEILAVVREIAAVSVDDGVAFDPERAAAEIIREEDGYSGIRVTLGGTLSRATVRLYVDVNVGDPIWPERRHVGLPRRLAGVLRVRGYPLEMVLAEKVATAIARGTANTRWRDFVDIYALAMRHPVSGATFRVSLDRVAQHRSSLSRRWPPCWWGTLKSRRRGGLPGSESRGSSRQSLSSIGLLGCVCRSNHQQTGDGPRNLGPGTTLLADIRVLELMMMLRPRADAEDDTR